MKLTRKQAILALLGIAGGSVAKMQGQYASGEAGLTKSLPMFRQAPYKYPMGLAFYLADEAEANQDGGGFHSLHIHYNGETRIFTAQEIWEALG